MTLDTELDGRAIVRRIFAIRGGRVVRKSSGEPPAIDKLGRTTIRWAPGRGGYITLREIREVLSAKKRAEVPKAAPPKRRKRRRTGKTDDFPSPGECGQKMGLLKTL